MRTYGLWVSSYITAFGFFTFFLVVFGLGYPWYLILGAALGLLGPFFLSRSSSIDSFLSQQVDEGLTSWLSKVFILLATVAFLSPFAWFCAEAYSGVWNPIDLGYATLLTFYLLKFVDFQVITQPRVRMTYVYAILFVVLALSQFLFLEPALSFQLFRIPDLLLLLVAAFTITVHGFWIRSVYSERQSIMLDAHPRLYFEMPYRGLFNVVGGMGMTTYLYVRLFLQAKNVQMATVALLFVVITVMILVPYIAQLNASMREIHRLRYGKEYKKLRPKVEKDSWEGEVVAKSRLASVIHSLVYFLVGFSLFSALYLGYLFALSWKISYLASALLCVFAVFPTQSYRMSAQGRKLKDFANLFPRLVDASDVRGSLGVVLAIYGIAVGIFVAALFLLRPYGFERTIFYVSGISITNVGVLVILLAVSIIVVCSVSLNLREIPPENLRRMFMVVVSVTYFVVLASLNLVFSIFLEPYVAAFSDAAAVVLFILLGVRIRKSPGEMRSQSDA